MKTIFIGKSKICGEALRNRLRDFSFAVLFDRALEEDENDQVMDWARDNLAGPIETDLREHTGLGPSGEFFFKNEEDAMMFYLKYK